MTATREEKQALTEAFHHEDPAKKEGMCAQFPKRYILAFMAFLGYCEYVFLNLVWYIIYAVLLDCILKRKLSKSLVIFVCFFLPFAKI